ncbi:MAG TPA: homoserine kinase [Candidatus Fraserbacteria bacterium]|nr:homoserine kinase [Candidatus Fraserbacteria bacterium]
MGSDSGWIQVYAPATVANCGPAFDTLGFALERPGDRLAARWSAKPGVRLIEISDESIGAEHNLPLPRDPAKNTAGIAAIKALKLAGASAKRGLELKLHKGVPPGSGLGSSAASAVAAAWAVGELLDSSLPRQALLEACLEAEAAVSGRFADNIAPALYGGFVLIRSYDPLEIISLPVPPTLRLVIVRPHYRLLTKRARAVLPERVTLSAAVRNWANVGALVAALYRDDPALLGRALQDEIVEPARAPLIPGFAEAKAAALQAGALGCAISGAGPALFAIADEAGPLERIAQAICRVFQAHGLESSVYHSGISTRGVHRI